MLNEIGAKIIGVVLNKAEVRENDYYYHYNYKGYGSESSNGEPATESKSMSIVAR
jgi:Mrp family chromosome partitioning ATPase